jgi:hypothetical protein
MRLLHRLAAWLWRPSAERRAALWSEIEAALARRRERRPALQARARKAAATRIINRRAGDRLAGPSTRPGQAPNPEERTN